MRKKCIIRNCFEYRQGLGYCRKHYTNFKRTQSPYGASKKCLVKGCKIKTMRKYCFAHLYRVKKGLSLNLSIDYRKIRMKGERNPNWRGGTSEYPNHCLMKKNRLIILINNPKCEFCKKPATEVHHKNGNKSDHRLSNLVAACHKCNSSIRFKPNNSKYRRLYGMNLQEITSKLGRSNYYWFTHQKERDKFLLDKYL